VKVELEDIAAVISGPSVDVLDLHDALEALAAFDARKADIVELHFFGGLSYDETAEAVGISAATVHRELRFAKAWLRNKLTGEGGTIEA
jgi:RNA polymerase sigma factor (sigma-70 family)